ncbi:probable serine/threonine-protein kinase PBL7 [Rutidosis leptorrhynchoides]|uniref:probable serine/threonine-protein kinase PBL7 n=1 Tax=Rutidosis leptorrhynchoides TaxID=125765 RepID=UPI003A99A548
MGLSQINTTQNPLPISSSLTRITSTTSSFDDDNDEIYHYNDEADMKFKNFIHKMIWDFGLACFFPTIIKKKDEMKKKMVNNLENNKAWLLAESGGCVTNIGNAEPHSVHSSFRFSLCSQVELESMSVNSSSATVLMVNLDNGLIEPRSQELKWGRIESLERSISPVAHNLIRFTYGEIISATSNFSTGRVLGRGALSCVFKGRVGLLKTTVAIKKLDKEDKEAPKAFVRELMIASSLHSHFIVPLVGFCIDPEGGLFLIYKYVSGGSLERYLRETRNGKNGGSKLSWSVRYKVAKGIAEAVRYLHNGTERCVVHRDIKPSNILLSSRKSPKLCDFGLATWTSAPSVPFLCKTVKGTFGYLAPEYFQHGKVSDKTDVYAFGVVLLELITGRKPIESRRGAGEENLVLWAKPLLQQGSIEKLLDPRIKFTQRNLEQISRMIQAADACINNEESKRPNIDDVISILNGVGTNQISRIKSDAALSFSNYVTDSYPQIRQTKNEMKSHLALAMLGVTEFDDDHEHLYCR